ncbi:MAG: hypothetical protein QM530_00415 [Phycisphaerales bacterium]|nr:hypothetical protein [Phycisphaerales bacterium]
MKINIVLIFLFVFLLSYYILSILLLDGRFTYTTSFNSGTIQESKKRNIFVSNDLVVIPSGKSLENWEENFEIWTNKRYTIHYFGFVFHYTNYYEGDRYLNVEFKPKVNRILKESCCYLYPYNKEIIGCCGQFYTKTNDTVKMVFVDCKNKNEIGALTIIVR